MVGLRASHRIWTALAVLGLLAGCRTAPSPDGTESPKAEATPTAPPPAETTAAPAEPVGPTRPLAAEPEQPAPAVTAAPLEGTLLNPKDGVKILMPDGWEPIDPDDGSLLQLVRRATIEDVRVNVTFDYSVDESLPKDLTIASIQDDFIAKMPEVLADRQFKVVDTKRVTVAGSPALAVRGDLTAEGRSMRMKQYLILADTTFWTLSVVGPRDQFDRLVEPEFDAIAASLELS